MAISRLRRNVPLILFCVAAFCIVGSYILILRGQQRRNIELYLNFEKVFFKGPVSNFTRGSERVRKNLIIVSHGRSGSSLMGDIFNHHPSVFYMYEPLQSPERVMKRLRGGNINYTQMVDRFLSGLFRCTFDDPDILYDMQRSLSQTRPSTHKPSYCISALVSLSTYRSKMESKSLPSHDK